MRTVSTASAVISLSINRYNAHCKMNTTRGARKKCKFGIAVLCTGKLIAPLQYEGAMSGFLFECWFKKTLLTTCLKSASSSWKMPFHKKKVVYPIAKKSSHPLDAVFAGIQARRAYMERVEAKRCKSNPSLQLCRQLPLASWTRRAAKLNHYNKIPVPPDLIYSNLQENTFGDGCRRRGRLCFSCKLFDCGCL